MLFARDAVQSTIAFAKIFSSHFLIPAGFFVRWRSPAGRSDGDERKRCLGGHFLGHLQGVMVGNLLGAVALFCVDEGVAGLDRVSCGD